MKEKQMDITLKQNEIDQAIRRYVTETIGVNLTGKRLGISYSATRGTAGVTASLIIEDSSDVQIPGYTDRDADPIPSNDAPKATVHTLTGVSGSVNAPEAEQKAAEVVEAAPEVAPEPVEGAEVVAAKPGLFAD
jgi:hypothetical protein